VSEVGQPNQKHQFPSKQRLDTMGAGDSSSGGQAEPLAPPPHGTAMMVTKFTYPFLGGLPSKILIHVPV
jgi:hypothetical protein